ncbi:MAG: DUF523 domain-containing protein [Myxococcota bacterium]
MKVPGVQQKVLVSACLTGLACRYDGRSKPSPRLEALLGGRQMIPVCPEELGELGTPRPPATLSGGDGHEVWAGRAEVVRVEDGASLTAAFITGAERAYANASDASAAILKARSPSCGCGETEIDGAKRPGDGVFAALLKTQGIPVFTDEAPLDSLDAYEV